MITYAKANYFAFAFFLLLHLHAFRQRYDKKNILPCFSDNRHSSEMPNFAQKLTDFHEKTIKTNLNPTPRVSFVGL